DTHLGGNVRVGAGAELGTGSIVTPGLTIGARAVLGAGCTVVRSLQGDSTYVGVPAAPVLRRARATGGPFARGTPPPAAPAAPARGRRHPFPAHPTPPHAPCRSHRNDRAGAVLSPRPIRARRCAW